MQVLVATADYPDEDGGINQMFVHVRDLYYKENGLKVEVLNFKAKKDYFCHGIRVITLATYKREQKVYDTLICHSANLRNHYVFLKRYGKAFRNFIFFFHGHEVLKMNKEYPRPYPFVKRSSFMKRRMRDLYDLLKLYIWRRYYPSVNKKSSFIFVSKWIEDKFYYYTGIKRTQLTKVAVIPNSVGQAFIDHNYERNGEKGYDFIFIRGNLDGSKYGVDIVNRLAYENPELSFLVIGAGNYFNYNKKAPNIHLINRAMYHEEMLTYINQSKCAILPTREDTQGVMTCEMLVYGIPVITSDIEVCQEFFKDKRNCRLISNDDNVKLRILLDDCYKHYSNEKETCFYPENTMKRELEIILTADKVSD